LDPKSVVAGKDPIRVGLADGVVCEIDLDVDGLTLLAAEERGGAGVRLAFALQRERGSAS
jgi:hypothetical protein